jgi:hypothetical protein
VKLSNLPAMPCLPVELHLKCQLMLMVMTMGSMLTKPHEPNLSTPSTLRNALHALSPSLPSATISRCPNPTADDDRPFLSDPANATPDSFRNHGEEIYTFQDRNAEYEERGAVLNVHCGVSEGIMAGVE